MDRSRIFFRLAYLFGLKPWDSGVPPPELRELVEGADALRPGRALDLGCGTGTNCIYLSRLSWDVTGVDYMPRAIASAQQKASSEAVTPRLLVGDVTRLDEIDVDGPFDLLLDLGCFHSVPQDRRAAYAAQAARVASPGAIFLLFAFAAGGRMLPSAPPEEIERRFAGQFAILEVRPGDPRGGQTWYRLQRLAA